MNNQLGWDKQEVPQTQSRTARSRSTTPISSGVLGKPGTHWPLPMQLR